MNEFQENLLALLRVTQHFVASFLIVCVKTDTSPHEVDEAETQRIIKSVEYLTDIGTDKGGPLPTSLNPTACEIIAALMDLTRGHQHIARLAVNFPETIKTAIDEAGSEVLNELAAFVKKYDTE
jgi:hypothetical protein